MPDSNLGSIAEKISELRESIHRIALAAGRPPEEIRLVLVSKTVSPDRISEAWRSGAREFGENRVQELLRKKEDLPKDIRWHFIGHLQTNKVKQVLGEVDLIHSLDRPELLGEIERQAALRKITSVDCLIQVNSSGEAGKFGFPPEAVEGVVSSLAQASPLRIRGLMTIGPNTEDETRIRAAFRRVSELRDELKKKFPDKDWGILSMGMSGDYRIAIEEGATLLRIGSAVFGARQNQKESGSRA